MQQVIEISGLTKEFVPVKNFCNYISHPIKREKVLAIDELSLQVRRAEIFTLIGPNGAGKTTLVKILACLISPTKGTVRILGYDVLKDEEKIKSAIGLVGLDERSFYWRLTLRENLYFFAALNGMNSLQTKRKIGELSSLLEIDDYLDRRFQECSSGIKQRLLIARSLLNNPSILLMDEPFKSLDSLSAKRLKNIIKVKLVGEQKKSVFFISHNLRELEDFSDRIAIMSKGKILNMGTLEELKNGLNPPAVSLEDVYEKATNFRG